MSGTEYRGPKKRTRAGNFDEADRQLIRHLVLERSDVIENKRRDTLTIKQKKAAWEEIACLFNSSSTKGPLTALRLGQLWERMKMDARKKLHQEKEFICKIESEPQPATEEENDTEYSAFQLENQYNSSAPLCPALPCSQLMSLDLVCDSEDEDTDVTDHLSVTVSSPSSPTTPILTQDGGQNEKKERKKTRESEMSVKVKKFMKRSAENRQRKLAILELQERVLQKQESVLELQHRVLELKAVKLTHELLQLGIKIS